MCRKGGCCYCYCMWHLKILLVIGPFFALWASTVWHYPFWWWWLAGARHLCETVPSRSERSDVYCEYVIRNFITPFKVEYLHRNPDLVLFHQLLPDEKRRQALNRYMLLYGEPSPIYTLLTDSRLEAEFYRRFNFRVSNITDIEKYQIRETPSVYELVDLATGLTTDNMDGPLSLQTYLPIGHIIPHHDVYPGSDDPLQGRRFATLIMYLVSPKRGGATIFPNIGLGVEAVAGDAVFFYNVYPTLEPDYHMSHAGCPVWEGRKTIGTFWFRQHHQEFLQPCRQDEETFKAFRQL